MSKMLERVTMEVTKRGRMMRAGRTRVLRKESEQDKGEKWGQGFFNYSFTNVREHVFTSLPFDPVLSTV